MQIVIEFPKEVWERYVNLALDGEALSFWGNLIANGTPLPKGHGDLIDRDCLELDCDWSDYYDGFSAYSESQVRLAPTVIEADKEESEE